MSTSILSLALPGSTIAMPVEYQGPDIQTHKRYTLNQLPRLSSIVANIVYYYTK